MERWAEKTDPSGPPENGAGIRWITPATMASWGDAGGDAVRNGRQGLETQWFAVTGRLTKVKAEEDGDLHLSLDDLERPGHIVVEIPLGDRWCALRKRVFSWTTLPFPFNATRSVKLTRQPIITVVGKAFYDGEHASKDNRRSYDSELAVWEIHPVMELSESSGAPVSRPSATPPPFAAPQRMPTPITTTTTPQEFVTLTRAVPIEIPYGHTTIPVGTRLPVLSRGSDSIQVRYLDGIYSVARSATASP